MINKFMKVDDKMENFTRTVIFTKLENASLDLKYTIIKNKNAINGVYDRIDNAEKKICKLN